MSAKEEFYEQIQEDRALVSDPEVMKCTCPETLCVWHGKCHECVAIHRYKKDHIPACLHPVVRQSLDCLLRTLEMEATKKEGTPRELRLYALERDKEQALTE